MTTFILHFPLHVRPHCLTESMQDLLFIYAGLAWIFHLVYAFFSSQFVNLLSCVASRRPNDGLHEPLARIGDQSKNTWCFYQLVVRIVSLRSVSSIPDETFVVILTTPLPTPLTAPMAPSFLAPFRGSATRSENPWVMP